MNAGGAGAERPVLRGAIGLLGAVGLLAGCAQAPGPSPVAAPVAATSTATSSSTSAAPPAPGVIARDPQRLLVRASPGEGWRDLAARHLGDPALHWRVRDANPGAGALPVPGQPLVVPLEDRNPLGVGLGPAFDQVQSVPVLCYHRFGPGGGKMTVSPERFAAQLEWLAKHDWTVLRLSDLTDFLQGRRALPRRSVVLTIDDGYESVHRHALPLLRRFGVPATLFVVSDFIGSRDGLSWPQLQELVDSGLVDVQAHSRTHRNFTERQGGESETAWRHAIEAELRQPRELLEKRLGRPVRQLAYPYGDANEAVLGLVEAQGLTLAATVQAGGNPFFAVPLALRRTMIFGDHDLDAFQARLQVSRGVGAP